MRKIAITGGIASGKSKLTNFLKSKGEVVIDLDEISHTLTDSDEDTINEISKILVMISKNNLEALTENY